eukprot:7189958-Pyramimonas_sp.AAC.1
MGESWNELVWRRLRALQGVVEFKTDMCARDLKCPRADAPVRNPSRILATRSFREALRLRLQREPRLRRAQGHEKRIILEPGLHQDVHQEVGRRFRGDREPGQPCTSSGCEA